MIIILLKLIFITYILVVAYIAASQDGMLLSSLREWAEQEKEAGLGLAQIFLCPWCAVTLFTPLTFAFAYGLDILNGWQWEYLILYFLTMCGASLASGITWSFYQMINAIKEFYEEQEDEQ